MKIKTLLFAMILGIPLFSCTNEEDILNKHDGSTYLNLDIQLPTSSATKADPDQVDYNDDGSYEGNDKIKTVDIYINGLDPIRLMDKDFLISAENKILPSVPIQAPAGNVTIYVVLNDPENPTAQSEDTKLPIKDLAKIEEGKDVILMNGKTINR